MASHNFRKEESLTLVNKLKNSLGGSDSKIKREREIQAPEYGNRSVHLRRQRSQFRLEDELPHGTKSSFGSDSHKVTTSSSKFDYTTTQVLDVNTLTPMSHKRIPLEAHGDKWKPSHDLQTRRMDDIEDILEDLDTDSNQIAKRRISLASYPNAALHHSMSELYNCKDSPPAPETTRRSADEAYGKKTSFSKSPDKSIFLSGNGAPILSTKFYANTLGTHFMPTPVGSAASKQTTDDDIQGLVSDSESQKIYFAKRSGLGVWLAYALFFLIGFLLGLGIVLIMKSTGTCKSSGECNCINSRADELKQNNGNSWEDNDETPNTANCANARTLLAKVNALESALEHCQRNLSSKVQLECRVDTPPNQKVQISDLKKPKRNDEENARKKAGGDVDGLGQIPDTDYGTLEKFSKNPQRGGTTPKHGHVTSNFVAQSDSQGRTGSTITVEDSLTSISTKSYGRELSTRSNDLNTPEAMLSTASNSPGWNYSEGPNSSEPDESGYSNSPGWNNSESPKYSEPDESGYSNSPSWNYSEGPNYSEPNESGYSNPPGWNYSEGPNYSEPDESGYSSSTETTINGDQNFYPGSNATNALITNFVVLTSEQPQLSTWNSVTPNDHSAVGNEQSSSTDSKNFGAYTTLLDDEANSFNESYQTSTVYTWDDNNSTTTEWSTPIDFSAPVEHRLSTASSTVNDEIEQPKPTNSYDMVDITTDATNKFTELSSESVTLVAESSRTTPFINNRLGRQLSPKDVTTSYPDNPGIENPTNSDFDGKEQITEDSTITTRGSGKTLEHKSFTTANPGTPETNVEKKTTDNSIEAPSVDATEQTPIHPSRISPAPESKSKGEIKQAEKRGGADRDNTNTTRTREILSEEDKRTKPNNVNAKTIPTQPGRTQAVRSPNTNDDSRRSPQNNANGYKPSPSQVPKTKPKKRRKSLLDRLIEVVKEVISSVTPFQVNTRNDGSLHITVD